MRTQEKRFWSKVAIAGEDDCWEWTAGKFTAGYGAFQVGSKPKYAHRVAYELVKGPIPEGAHLLHSCDNPGCVNPAHLTAGTPKQNIRDAATKGRWMSDKRREHLSRLNGRPVEDIGEREIEVLEALASFPEGGDRWARPMDCGGRVSSHHARTLAKLAKMGLADVRCRPNYSRSTRLYQITDAGLAALPAKD